MGGKGLADLLRVEECVEDVNDRDNDNISLLAGYEDDADEEAVRQSTAKVSFMTQEQINYQQMIHSWFSLDLLHCKHLLKHR